MSSTLSEGVRVPDIGSTSWGADVNYNWGLLNIALANISGNVKTNVANTWTAPQTFTETINGIAARAVGDEDGTNIKTAIASKATDSAVVHLTGAETIEGSKTFLSNNTRLKNLAPSANLFLSGILSQMTKGDVSRSDNFGLLIKDKTDGNVAPSMVAGLSLGQNSVGSFAQINVDTIGSDSVRHNNGVQLQNDVTNTDNSATFYPQRSGLVDLGTTTNKWRTLNGINPGALSLPINSNSASYNIDTTNWTTDGSIIAYTPLLDGWIYINARNDDTNGDSFIIFDDGVSGFGTSVFGNKGLPNSGAGLLCLMMPVNKNNGINIRIKSPGIISARLYPCNGNV